VLRYDIYMSLGFKRFYGPLDEEVLKSEDMAPHILKFGTR